MAIPSVVSSSQNSTSSVATRLTVTLGAGLSYVAIFCTKTASLSTDAPNNDINNTGSGWTCLVGTHGGASFSGSPTYGIYLFQKVTTAAETISTGTVSTGSKGYVAITLSGYDTSSPYEVLASGSGTFSGSSPYTANVAAMTTTGADRLPIWFVAASNFAAGALTYTNGALASPSTTGLKTSLGTGDISLAYGGKAAAGSTGTTAHASTAIGYVGAGYVYALLAVKPTASTTYDDSATGTLGLVGTSTEGLLFGDALPGTATLTGASAEAHAGTDAISGLLPLTGTSVESYSVAGDNYDATTGILTLSGHMHHEWASTYADTSGMTYSPSPDFTYDEEF